MRTHSLLLNSAIVSLATIVLTATPAAAATLQQAASRRSTPTWIWLLLLLAIVLLVWWLWNSSRQMAERKQNIAAQPKVPESLGDALSQAPAAAKAATPAIQPARSASAKPDAAAPPSEPASVRSEPTVTLEAAVEEIVVENIPPTPGVALAGEKSQPGSPATASAGAPEAQRSAPAVAPEAPPAAKPKRAKSTKSGSDDLTVVEGIGPKISSILHAAGITSYAALAATSVDDLRTLIADNNLRFADPSTWPEQAALAGTDPEKLAELKATLKGGRRQ